MKQFSVFFLTLILAGISQAEDFSLTVDGIGPIRVHTSLVYEGKGERLIASATNASAEAIPYVKFCVVGPVKDCLFTMWTTTEWKPGASLDWNMATALHTRNLLHRVVIYGDQIEDEPAPAPAETLRPAPQADARRAPIESPEDLRLVRKIFIEPMPYSLDQYIRVELVKQAPKRVRVVLDRSAADAVLTGSSEEKSGVLNTITGRYFGLEDNAIAAISLVDVTGKNLLWAGEAGDRSLLWGVLARGGERKVASRIVGKLLGALR